jgi:hypothetical protein
MSTMKRYEVLFDEQKNEGVYAISLVNSPAMESTWVALKEAPLQFAEVDSSRKILLGIVLIPDKPIYRNDRHGEYELIFSAKTIEKVAHNFIRAGKVGNTTEEHSVTLSGEQASVVEAWLIEDEVHDKTRKYSETKDAPVGSWAVMMKVDDDGIYNKARNGELRGFSIEGLFDTELILNSNKQMEVKSITEAITDGFKDIKAFFTSEPVAEPAQAAVEPAATEAVAEPTQEVNLAEVLKTEFSALSTLLSEKFTAMETKFADQQKTIEAQDAKIVELSKEPASRPVKSKPQQVDLSKMTKKERILFTIQNAN